MKPIHPKIHHVYIQFSFEFFGMPPNLAHSGCKLYVCMTITSTTTPPITINYHKMEMYHMMSGAIMIPLPNQITNEY